MSDKTVKAQRKLERAEGLLRKSKIIFILFLVMAACVIAYQLYAIQRNQLISQHQADEERDEATKEARERLNKALAENERLHRVTQEYIKCIATVLLLPIPQREPEDFERCSVPVREENAIPGVPSTTTPGSIMSEPIPTEPRTAPPKEGSNSQPNTPTTSGGGDDPDDDTTAANVDVQACILFNILCSKIKI